MKIRLPALLLAALLLLCACTGAEAVPAAGGAPTAAQPSPAVTAELPEDIDLRRAQEAKERAEEQLRQKQSIVEHSHSEASLARALTRLRIKEKYV